jgi:LysR family transcriptional regulator, transcriptional activator of the cysJI operon
MELIGGKAYMELKQLEAFAAVARLGSFTRAANAIRVSQPTVTHYIAALEHELNCELLIRTSSDVSLTEAGVELLGYAQRFEALERETIDALQVAPEDKKGTLTIAASSVPANCFLPELISAFRQGYPDVVCRVRSCNSAEVVREVMRGRADVGMSGAMPERTSCLFAPFATDHLVLIAAAGERFDGVVASESGASALPVFPTVLLPSRSYIVREKGSGTRLEGEAALRARGIDTDALSIIAEIPQTDVIVKMVAGGMGVALLSAYVVADAVSAGEVQAFELEGPADLRNFYLLVRQTRSTVSLARLFYDHAQSFYAHKVDKRADASDFPTVADR